MERNKMIDIAKGIGILLVVLGHCAVPTKLYAFIYLFHMPLFFFTAGLVFRPTANSEALFQKKKRTLLIPYAVYGLAFVVIDTLLNASGVDGFTTNFLKLFIQIHYSVVWFLLAMFITVVFANGLLKKSAKVLNITVIALFVFHAIYQHFFPRFGLPFTLSKIPVTLLYFTMGYYLKKFVSNLSIKSSLLSVLVGVITIFVWAVSGCKVTQNIFNDIYYNYLFIPLLALPIIIAILGCSYLIGQRYGNFLSFLGKNSLTIFGVHQVFFTYIIEIILKPENNLTFALIEFVFALSISLLFVFLFRKFEKRCRIFHYL